MKLTNDQVSEYLRHLDGWSLKNEKLHKEYLFDNFKEAFAFMGEVAKVAEDIQHHPEWCNVYAKVTVNLFTHDINGISEKDITLAKQMAAQASLKGA